LHVQGQLHAIREQLKTMRGFSAKLSELDEQELRQAEDKQAAQKAKQEQAAAKGAASAAAAAAPAGASTGAAAAAAGGSGSAQQFVFKSPAAASSSKPTTVRLATIDNYQGEENELVLVSLVRSNPSGQIGFMGEPERVNVMLSRARCAMIIFGNAETFRSAKKQTAQRLWSKITDLMHGNGYLHAGLPVVCQQHPSEKHTLSRLEHFDEYVKHGGCRAACGQQMQCLRHNCPLKCHADTAARHERCKEKMTAVCAQNHTIEYTCDQHGTEAARQCGTCDRIERKRKEAEQKAAAAAKRLAEATAKEQERVAQLQAESSELDKEIAAAEDTKQRQLEEARIAIEKRSQATGIAAAGARRSEIACSADRTVAHARRRIAARKAKDTRRKHQAAARPQPEDAAGHAAAGTASADTTGRTAA
jgi:hypothetical protein